MRSRWREQYDRMKRWQTRITKVAVVDDRHLDDFDALFVCCFHLKDKTDWMFDTGPIDESGDRRIDTLVVPVVRASGDECLAPTVANECVAAWEKFLTDRGLLSDNPCNPTDQASGLY